MGILRSIRIQTRLSIQLILIVIGLVILISGMLSQLHSSLLAQKSQNTKQLVELAYSAINFYHQKEVSGELSKEAAQSLAKQAVGALRYEDNNYFWIQSTNNEMVMHPIKPALIGQNLNGFKDPAGNLLFNNMIDMVKKNGEGQVDYQWPLPSESDPVDKISYVKGFAPWGWIVGSGVYLVDVQAAFQQAAVMPIIIGALIIVILTLLSIVVGRSIRIPLSQTSDALNDIASGDGDLTQRLEENSQQRDEIAGLAKSFNAFVNKIEGTMIEVSQATTHLNDASSQLRAVVESNASSMQNQQQESQAVATAVTEMSTAATQIAGSSETAAVSAKEANDEANSGRQVVEEAISAVKQLAEEVNQTSSVISNLNANSQSISSVLEVISGIAEQTNLLALNAAIEAARAGDQGRGFAVVADEVRTLAARTQTSTEEIRKMIEALQEGSNEAVNAMERGERTTKITVEKAETAGESLERIVESIKNITDLNMQIASAAEEQSACTLEIDQGIVRIADLSTESFNEIEKTSESSRELEELSNTLHRLVAQFKLSQA